MKNKDGASLRKRIGNLEVAKVLIQNGVDVNAVDCRKWTALHSQPTMDVLTLQKC